MNDKCIFVGDVHLKSKIDSPYNRGIWKLLHYLKEKYADHTWIFTGDFFDENIMNYDVVRKAINLIEDHNSIIVSGNHEIGYYGNILDIMPNHIQIIKYMSVKEICGYKIMFLPYLKKLSDMKIYEEDKYATTDITVGHFALKGQNHGAKDEIRLQCKANIVHINGHIHLPLEQEEDEHGKYLTIAVPQVTRNLEQHFIPRVCVIENGQYRLEDLPVFCTIEDVVYGNQPKSVDNILNIIDAPSADMVRDFYKDMNIRNEGIKLLRTESDGIKQSVDKIVKHDVLGQFDNWAIKNNKSKEVIETIKEYLTV